MAASPRAAQLHQRASTGGRPNLCPGLLVRQAPGLHRLALSRGATLPRRQRWRAARLVTSTAAGGGDGSGSGGDGGSDGSAAAGDDSGGSGWSLLGLVCLLFALAYWAVRQLRPKAAAEKGGAEEVLCELKCVLSLGGGRRLLCWVYGAAYVLSLYLPPTTATTITATAICPSGMS